jgi:hypothetical protein
LPGCQAPRVSSPLRYDSPKLEKVFKALIYGKLMRTRKTAPKKLDEPFYFSSYVLEDGDYWLSEDYP